MKIRFEKVTFFWEDIFMFRCFLFANFSLLGFVFAQTRIASAVVGYETLTLKGGQYNLCGLRLLQKSLYVGNVNWDGALFTNAASSGFSILSEDIPYQLELKSGEYTGLIVAVVKSDNGLALHEISAGVDLNAFSEVECCLRQSVTLDSLFGSPNRVNLDVSDTMSSGQADEVLLRRDGVFEKFFYTSATPSGWYKETSSGVEMASDTPILSTEAFMFYRKAEQDLDIVVSGYVKMSNTIYLLKDTYNYLSSSYPIGMTLGSSGLSSSVTPTDVMAYGVADEIHLPSADKVYRKCIFYQKDGGAGWFYQDLTGAFVSADTLPLVSGFALVKRSVEDSVLSLDSPLSNL